MDININLSETYYDILGLPKFGRDDQNRKITSDQIRKAYERKRREGVNLEKIAKAYAVLSTPEERSKYDRRLQEAVMEAFNHRALKLKKTKQDQTKPGISDVGKAIKKGLPIGLTAMGVLTVISSASTNIASLAASTLVPAAIIGVVGFVGVKALSKVIKKYVLKKDNSIVGKEYVYRYNKITKITTENSQLIQNYFIKLDNEINALLSKPNRNYELEIYRIKYRNQIKLIEQLIELELNKKGKKGEILKSKMRVVSLKIQLDTAQKNLAGIEQKISEASKSNTSSLRKLNLELMKINREIEIAKSDKSKKSAFGIKKLEKNKSSLLDRRNAAAKRLKLKVIREGNIYDRVQKGVKLIRHSNLYLTKAEDVEDLQVSKTR